jgi:hypothetical protein
LAGNWYTSCHPPPPPAAGLIFAGAKRSTPQVGFMGLARLACGVELVLLPLEPPHAPRTAVQETATSTSATNFMRMTERTLLDRQLFRFANPKSFETARYT